MIYIFYMTKIQDKSSFLFMIFAPQTWKEYVAQAKSMA
jgi:hypothetical protein